MCIGEDDAVSGLPPGRAIGQDEAGRQGPHI
jgi:hypothetical protein